MATSSGQHMAVLDAPVETLPMHMLNAVNRELSAEVAQFQTQREQISEESQQHKQRLAFLREHLQNVMTEVQQSQSLLTRKRSEVESQQHRTQLTERESAALKQRNEKLLHVQEDLEEKINASQSRVLQGHVRLAELKQALNVNEEKLQQWDLARQQKEEDEGVIAKYKKADETRAKQLVATVESLQKLVNHAKIQLEEETLAAQAVQAELQACATTYTKQQADRENLHDEWEQAIRTMQLRDEVIVSAAEQYGKGVEWIGKRREVLKAYENELEEEVGMTGEINAVINQQEKLAQRCRDDTVALTQLVRDLDDEVNIMRENMQRSVRERESRRAQLKALNEEVARKRLTVEKMEKRKMDAEQQLEEEKLYANDLEHQTRIVASLLKEATYANKEMEKEEQATRGRLYQAGQQLHVVRQQQQDVLVEISGAQAQARNLKAKLAQLDSESFKQQELIYNAEFNVQQMERKVNYAKGERSVEKQNELHETIDHLQNVLTEATRLNKAMQEQVKRVMNELRQTAAQNSRLLVDRRRVEEKVLEVQLASDSCATDRLHLQRQKEELLVQDDVRQLQLERLQRRLIVKDGKLLSLEAEREQLEAEILQRMMAIDVHHQMLRMEAKLTEEERKKLVSEMLERQKTLKALQNRCAVIVGRVAGSSDGNGEPLPSSPAELIVKAAKEREHLQRKGDRIDRRVKRAERELAKLEKSVAMLRDSNSVFRHMFDKVGPEDPELQENQLLQQRATELKRLIHHRATEAIDCGTSASMKAGELQEWNEELQHIVESRDRLEQECHDAFAKVAEVKERIARFEVAIARANNTVDTDVKNDVELLEAKERLAIIAKRYLELVASTNDEELVVRVERQLMNGGVGAH